MRPVLLVTGGSRGIGAATATLAAGRGYDVCLSYRDDAGAAAEVVAACEAQGRAPWPYARRRGRGRHLSLFDAAAAWARCARSRTTPASSPRTAASPT
jgi:NAD(P)-dependent dehydrogenase (short-subunit alcohol dehydrogenase family)